MRISYDDLRDEAIHILEDNDELFNNICEELDSWNGFLGDDRLFPMYELDDIFSGKTPTEMAELIEGNNFSTNDEYFYCDIYGLQSTDDKNYKDVKNVTEVMDELENEYYHCDWSLRGEFLLNILEALDEGAEFYEFDEENEEVEVIDEDEEEEEDEEE